MAMLMVTAEGLNFRSTPDPSSRANILAVLGRGHQLEKTGHASRPSWIAARTHVSGESLQGFVNGLHTGPVAPTGPTVPPGSGDELPPADRGRHDGATRSSASAGMRTYSLGESNRPRSPSAHGSGRPGGIVAIVNWLDCGRSAHARWWPAGGQTFCNIYAYDVCTLAGAYLPRVWWNDGATRDLRAGRPVEVRLPSTVRELNANALYDWLEEHGRNFGWTRHFQPGEAQDAANSGRIAIICAQRRNLNRSGHINVIVPEHGPNKAARSAGTVTRPLQSNAGTTNYTLGVHRTAWWRSDNFRAFGLWSAPTG